MRLMSFALTTVAFYRREKTVTRRLDWEDLEPGELLCGVQRCQGLRKGESPVRLAIIRVSSVRREPLLRIRKDPHEVVREGFPDMKPEEFVDVFCMHHRGCKPASLITRIEFNYVPGGRYPVFGFCRRCGCFQDQACFSEEHGACWWVTDKGEPTMGATTLCSHCFHGFETDVPDWVISQEMGDLK